MTDMIYAAIISGCFVIAAAVISIILGSRTVVKKIRIQKKYDKIIEFQELASPITTAMLSQANDIIRGNRKAVYPFNQITLTQRDRYGVDRKFWEVHAIYEPLIPEDLWDAYGELGKAFEKINHEYMPKAPINDDENKESARNYIEKHKVFLEKLKQHLSV